MAKEEISYDKYVDFYLTNLINSLILFSSTKIELEELIKPDFDPIFELESEFDYAFNPICFDTIFRNEKLDLSMKEELLLFKQKIDKIPNEIWAWEYIDNHPIWVNIRLNARKILDIIGIKDRIYCDDYLTVYDNNGNILKHRKNSS